MYLLKDNTSIDLVIVKLLENIVNIALNIEGYFILKMA